MKFGEGRFVLWPLWVFFQQNLLPIEWALTLNGYISEQKPMGT